ncbi:MAG: hypothetical protein H6735_33580 [Alphaproteobacteria bacterium]|nr:hypothetical protein [Alphaproteobacteria bacterium]
MAIYDLFLNNPRTRAARYQGSRAEQGAMRSASGVLQNRSTNPAAAAQALQGARADQRAANAGMIAQAQAADETAKAEGVQQLVGTGLSTLGSVLPFATMGGGAAQPAVDAGLGMAQQGLGQALGNPAGGPAPAPSVAETSFHGFSQGMPGMGQPQTAWQQYGQAPMMQPPANPYDDLAQGVPAPNYAPQTPQSAMPAERQGPMAPGAAPGTMMRPPQSTMLSAGQPGSYIPSPQPAFEGQPQEQPPALSPMAARLSGMAPVQDIPAPPPPVPTSPSDQFMQLLQQSAFPYLQLDPANLNPLQYLRSR